MSVNLNFHGVKSISLSELNKNNFGVTNYFTRTLTVTFEDNSVSLIDFFATEAEALEVQNG